MGLVNEIVPAGRHLERALEMAEALAALPAGHDARRPPRRDRGHRPARFAEGLALEARSGAAHARDRLARRRPLRRRRGPRRRGRRASEPGLACPRSRSATCASRTARWRPCAACPSRSSGARCSACSARTAPARRPRSRSSRATARRSGGEVRVLGHDPAEPRPRASRSGSGIVLQSCGFYPRVTVREAVEHFAKAYPQPRDAGETIDARRARARRPTRAPKELSGGQRRRLDLALALVGRPRARLPRRAHHRLRPRRPAHRLGRGAQAARSSARRCCSPPTTWTRPRSSPTGWRSSRTAAIVAEGPPDRARPEQRPLPRLLPLRRPPRRARDRRPDRAAAPPDRATRWPAASGSRASRSAGPTLEDVYLELTARTSRMSPAALAWEQFRFERKLFWRNPSAAFFNFLLPLLLLVLIATAFSSDERRARRADPGHRRHGRDGHDLHRARLQRSRSCREEGILKRVRGTPMPAGAYLGGLIGSAVAQRLPAGGAGGRRSATSSTASTGPRDRLLLAGFTLLGVVCFALARRRVLARHPERGRRSRLHQRGLPAADLHLGRLLLGRRPARGAQGDRRGAAAQAPDRRALGRRSSAAARTSPCRGAWSAAGRSCGLLLAVRFFRWE